MKLFLLLLSLLATQALALESPKTVHLKFDMSRSHPFEGFGAQVWPHLEGADEGFALLKDMNAKFIRIALAGNVPTEKIKDSMSPQEIAKLIAGSTDESKAAKFKKYVSKAQAQGLKLHLIFWQMPEEWTIAKNKKAGKKKVAHFADPSKITLYAKTAVAQLLYLKSLGIEPYAVELTNEPHGAWDTKFEPSQYASYLHQARVLMNQNGLAALKIDGPGVGIRKYDEFEDALVKSGAIQDLGLITGHIYQSPAQLSNPATPGVATFLGRGQKGPIAITEFGVKKHNADDALSGQDLDVNSYAYALSAAAQSLILISKRATQLIYWQLQDFSWAKKQHGLLTEDGKRRPTALAFQTLFGELAVPAMTTEPVSSDLPAGVYVQAFRSGGETSILLANMTSQEWPLEIELGSSGAAPLRIAKALRFAKDGKMTNLLSAFVKGNKLQLSLMNESIARITLKK